MKNSALDSITIRGFKSIASLEVKLRSINLLIGANGSGKSNFIGVLSFLRAVREARLANYVTASGGAEKILHFGSKTTPQIDFHLFFDDFSKSQYQLTLTPNEDDGLFPSDEWVAYRNQQLDPGSPDHERLYATDQGREAGISKGKLSVPSSRVRHWLGQWRAYHVHDTSPSSPMRKTAHLDDNRFLRPDGSNLAAFLYYLQEKHFESYNLIERTVQRVAPFFDRFQLQPLKLRTEDIKLEWRHKNSDQYFDAAALSDGTLRFIALATLFLQPAELQPSMILVDEPELGLHPYAIGMLAALIKQASKDSQLIVSTQSSLLLDHFEPEDVLVFDRVRGATQITRLDSASLSEWLTDYSLGQLWEKNEFGGRPVPA